MLIFHLEVSEEWIQRHKLILDSIQVTEKGQQQYVVYKRIFNYAQTSVAMITLGMQAGIQTPLEYIVGIKGLHIKLLLGDIEPNRSILLDLFADV